MENLKQRLAKEYATRSKIVEEILRLQQQSKEVNETVEFDEQEAVKRIYDFVRNSGSFDRIRSSEDSKLHSILELDLTEYFHDPEQNFGLQFVDSGNKKIEIWQDIDPENFAKYAKHDQKRDLYIGLGMRSLTTIIGIPITFVFIFPALYHTCRSLRIYNPHREKVSVISKYKNHEEELLGLLEKCEAGRQK